MVVSRRFACHYAFFFFQFTGQVFFFCEHLIAFKCNLFDRIPSSIIHGWGCNFSPSFIKIYCYAIMHFCGICSVLRIHMELGYFFTLLSFFVSSFHYYLYGFFFILEKRISFKILAINEKSSSGIEECARQPTKILWQNYLKAYHCLMFICKRGYRLFWYQKRMS